jgi:hypothetical protein
VSTHLKVGDKLPLVAHLECPEGVTLYVEAVIKKPDRTQIGVSPLDLTDEGEGLFIDDSVLMPDLDYLTVTYKVYEDALKTTLSEDFCQVTVVFNKELPDTSSQENLASIELDLDLDLPFLDLSLESSNIELDTGKPLLELNIETMPLVMDIGNSSIDFKIDQIALELNLECCS